MDNNSVYGLFERAVQEFPDHIAVSLGDTRLSYVALAGKVSALREKLLAETAGEELIGVSTSRSVEMIVAVLAITAAGKAYLPLDPGYPAQRLGQITADSGIKTCLAGEAEHPLFTSLGLKCIQPFAENIAAKEILPLPEQNPNIYVLYTSGSTGVPKGVYMTQEAMLNLIIWQHANSAAGPGTSTLQFAPLSFDVSFQEIFATLTTGATLVLISDDLRLDPVNLLEYINTYQVDRIFLPFVALQFLAEAASGTKQFPQSLKEVMTAGEQLKITPQVKEFFEGLQNCILFNQYGPTECHVVTQLQLQGDPATWPLLPNIGTPIANTDIYILDEHKNILPKGETGELAIGGVSLASGYLNKPELTAEKFCMIQVEGVPARVYLTGDLASYSEDGTIDFLGRRDDQVKIRGYRIELAEIEVLLNEIDGIKQAIVIARNDLSGQSRLLAYLVAGDGIENTPAVRAFLAAKLPDYMIPSAFVWMDVLPKTTSGKVDKKALPSPERKRPEISVLFVPAKTSEEKKIAAAWAAVLELDTVGTQDNFFELGGNSLLALKTVSMLRSEHHIKLPITKLYQFPTITQLVNYLNASSVKESRKKRTIAADPVQPIAIIGMAGKFPGAASVDELWELLREGRESVSFFSKEELDASIPAEVKNDPQYVSARGIIEDAGYFDPLFFGINPKLAEAMDPQQRIFLEISRDVLEKSGHLPAVYDGLTGVFAGSGNNSYYQNNVSRNPELIGQVGSFQVMTVNEKDYISSRTAYELDLKGPAVSVYSACSTSLLAVAQAVESLRKQQCDIAIAGGVSITAPLKSGHIYQEGAMLSVDGHCRSFDAKATGTVFSDGAGVVLLKTLAAAKADGDTIYGIIKGTGVNNDGGSKGSFTAPSTDGQATAIAMAITEAGIDPATISYVEAHGTATPLGDPIEIEGLKQAFGEQPLNQYCAIGSIKSNMGHMVAASGVAGLIKTTLALYHKQIPPSVNFDTPNPEISFADSPFYVNRQLKDWDTNQIRRAGVSSFGVGGTNVHVIVEEHDHQTTAETAPEKNNHIFTWSAKSAESLKGYRAALHRFVSSATPLNLSDAAFTLQTTRENFNYRNFVIADNRESLENALETIPAAAVPLKHLPGETVFLFPGQGAQYLNMGAELYHHEPVYKAAVDECALLLKGHLDRDIREVMYGNTDDVSAQTDLANTKYTQPALFVTSYALAQLWMSWGIQPSILCGHSIGEYVAAHLAGVFSLEEALELIATRGALVSRLPGGSMLSVRAAHSLIEEILPASLSMAAINSPKLCVVAGPDTAIEEFQQLLDQKEILHKKLLTSHAFHSSMMDPVLNDFGQVGQRVKLNRPQKPIVSTVTGKFLTDAEAQDPAYWINHLRNTVRFSAAIDTILELDNPLLLESGPGNTCTTLAFQHGSKSAFTAIASLERKGGTGDEVSMLNALGKVWTAGLNPDWKSFYSNKPHQITDLPTYSYNKKKYWAEPATAAMPQPIQQPVTNGSIVMRKDTLIDKIKNILENASGIEMDGVTPDMSFIEIGLDSLLLTQVALTLKKEFALPITFRQLNEEYSSLETLAGFIDQSLPQETAAPAVIQSPVTLSPSAPAASFAPADSALGLIAQQLQLLSRQVELMTGAPQTAQVQQAPALSAKPTVLKPVKTDTSGLSAEELAEIKKPFGATARIEKSATALEPYQKAFLEELTERYNKKTAGSKAFTQKNRAHMADPRVVSGFKPYTKEIVYSIVTNRSEGSHLWDIDGNEYVDALNGFGSNLLGYQHPVLKAAVLDQVERGYEIGPQHELAGEVSKLICEFTGFDRAALCNTGSEAVLGALRIARTVTGRSLIVAFTGSYHGINDEVIIRGTKKLKSFPAAPGILPEAVQNMLILDYGTEESLQIIRDRADEIAAVLVEPVQSRRPEFQPVEFLKAVREITLQSETVLIFDEVITGFRAHQGGAQAIFGIQADLGTYGKVIGGGMPIGAIAGKKQYMDALDGGFWQYGDDSFPEIGVTYFAGTFVRHPLALAAGLASLLYMKEKGTDFQLELNRNTTQLADMLNATAEEFGLPLYAAHFGSLWKIKFKEEYPYSELLFTLMRDKGIHIWDGFPCFLTASHTQEEIRLIATRFRESVEELLAVNLIPVKEKSDEQNNISVNDLNTPPVKGARMGKDQSGNPAWFVTDPEQPGKYLQIVS